MERETVKEVLRRLNESGARYCLIGGLALAHHSIPRLTQDVDILILPEDIAYICRALLATADTPEDVKKYRAQIEWLNGVLEKPA